MVEVLPALPPMNYENLNKRIGELDDYPLEIPVAVIAIALAVSTIILIITLIVIACIIYRLRANVKSFVSNGKIISRTSYWIRDPGN